MIVIIAGSRNFNDVDMMVDAINSSGFKIDKIVSGAQKSWNRELKQYVGADYFGECYAQAMGIPIERFPANWKQFGLSAGPKRNREMAEYAKAHAEEFGGAGLIAMPGGIGTENMITEAIKRGLKVFVARADEMLDFNFDK